MRVTQQEIAKKAGVSQTGVSMILRENKGFNCSPDIRRKVLSVLPDNLDGMTQCVRHLHELGHRHIAYCGLPGPPVGGLHQEERHEGFRNTLSAFFRWHARGRQS